MSSESPAAAPHPRLWEQKNPWVAGILAFLVPGAGHLYQGRTMKGVLYLVSILGLFFWGQRMGEGMVIYNRPEAGAMFKYVSLSYAAQFGAGAAALPAFVQNRRALQEQNRPNHLRQATVLAFEGTLNPAEGDRPGRLVGTVKLTPVDSPFGVDVEGTFEGTLDGQPQELKLGGRFALDPAVQAGHRRALVCGVVDADSTHRWIAGSVPRPLFDSYAAPPSTDQLQNIAGRLGKIYELALVFTWVAGLLNILAIWDCVLGPAYGFGDEPALARKAEAAKAAPDAAPAPASTPEAPASQAAGKPPA